MRIRIVSIMFSLSLVAGVLAGLSAPAYSQQKLQFSGYEQKDREWVREQYNALKRAAADRHTAAYNHCLTLPLYQRPQCTGDVNLSFQNENKRTELWRMSQDNAIRDHYYLQRQGLPKNRTWQPGQGQQGTLIDNNVTKKNPKLDNKPRGQYKQGTIVYGKNPAPSKARVERYKPDGNGGWKRVE